MNTEKITIPPWMMNIKYNPRIIPNGKEQDIISNGANCQVFAYHLLRHNNRIVPDFRSSELWDDDKFSIRITEDYQPLDVLFFHRKQEAYGAHIGVFIGNNQVIHNAKKIGLPIIWELNTFFEYPDYQFLLGGKRFFKEKTL